MTQDSDDEKKQDPTRVRNQPALGPNAGAARWLIPSGIMGVVAVVLFALAIPIAPAVAWIGIALQVGLFVAMCVTAGVVGPGRYRSFTFAWLTIAMAASALVLLIVILVIAWAGVPQSATGG